MQKIESMNPEWKIIRQSHQNEWKENIKKGDVGAAWNIVEKNILWQSAEQANGEYEKKRMLGKMLKETASEK